MNISNINWFFLFCSILFLNACGSSSDSDSGDDSPPDIDMRGDWTMTLREGASVKTIHVTITSHNMDSGKFKGQGDNVSKWGTMAASYNVSGKIRWSTPPVGGPGQAALNLRVS